MVEHTFSGPDSGSSFEAGHGFTPANDRGTPLSSFDSERPFGHAPEHDGPGDSDFGDVPTDVGSASASGSGADVAASDDGEPRRRRRRRGRRGRGRRDEQAQPQDAEVGVEGAAPSDDSGPVEPPLAEDDLPAPTDAPRASPDSAGEPREGGRRRRRGRRGRGRRDVLRTDGAPFERTESSGTPDLDAEARTDAMSPSSDDAERALDAPREPARDGAGAPREGGRRRRRGRGRGRDRAHVERDVRREAAGPERVAEDRGSEAAEGDGSAAGFDAGRTSEENSERRRRRRGRRGGRRKRGEPAGPVGVEIIPGDDDDLQVAVVAPSADELPELPDEAHLLSPAEPKRGRRERPRREERRDDEEEPERATSPRRKNVILVNASDPEEVRVAVVEGHQLADFQMTARRHKSYVNDIYRGKVVNLEPAIGAAFIDFGEGRNGFLHTSDVLSVYGDPDWSLEKLLTTKVDPDEWEEGSGQPHIDADVAEGEDHPAGHAGDHAHDAHEDHAEHGGHADDDHDAEAETAVETPAPVRAPTPAREARRGGHKRMRARPRLPISDLLKKGDTVVVQVTKDAIGDKGPTLTTYISIPGRYLVLMPSMSRTGVSRKIEDERERRRLKRILAQLDIPPGMGVIVRTAGTNATKADLKRDLDYLMLLWDSFGKRLVLGRGPAPLYEESDVAIRTIRDLFTPATESVIVDDPKVFERVREFTEKLMPENIDRIKLHEGTKPLFHAHNVEQEFERLFARRIDLPSGGSIVFDQAEALVAIDVNSGKTRSDGFDFEDIALKTNLDAVPEIARQIRLRDLGGIIVIDFIDMQRAGSRRAVERAFRDAIEDDRARSKLGRISQFGLLELTRQRLGPGLVKMIFANCPRCRGSGRLRTSESRAQAILRRLGAALALKGFTKVEVRTQPEVVEHLKRYCHDTLKLLETQHAREIALSAVPDQVEDSVLRYLRADGREVRPGGRRKR